jgi:hypothetical protein
MFCGSIVPECFTRNVLVRLTGEGILFSQGARFVFWADSSVRFDKSPLGGACLPQLGAVASFAAFWIALVAMLVEVPGSLLSNGEG